MWRRVRENGEASRGLLKLTCCRKGKLISGCSEISQALPLQQVWLKKSPAQCPLQQWQLFVQRTVSPSPPAVPRCSREDAGQCRQEGFASAAREKPGNTEAIFQETDPENWADWSWQRTHAENVTMGEPGGRRCYLWFGAKDCKDRMDSAVISHFFLQQKMDELHGFSSSPAPELTWRPSYTYFLTKTMLIYLWGNYQCQWHVSKQNLSSLVFWTVISVFWIYLQNCFRVCLTPDF